MPALPLLDVVISATVLEREATRASASPLKPKGSQSRGVWRGGHCSDDKPCPPFRRPASGGPVSAPYHGHFYAPLAHEGITVRSNLSHRSGAALRFQTAGRAESGRPLPSKTRRRRLAEGEWRGSPGMYAGNSLLLFSRRVRASGRCRTRTLVNPPARDPPEGRGRGAHRTLVVAVHLQRFDSKPPGVQRAQRPLLGVRGCPPETHFFFFLAGHAPADTAVRAPSANRSTESN